MMVNVNLAMMEHEYEQEMRGVMEYEYEQETWTMEHEYEQEMMAMMGSEYEQEKKAGASKRMNP